MGCNLTNHNKNGWTAGHFAASVGSVQILQALHENGDPLNQRNAAAWTPLHYAMKYNHRQCVEYLVRIKAFVFDSYDSFASLLHMAAICNYTEAVQSILRIGQSIDTITHNHWDFLQFAASNGAADLLRTVHQVISHDKFLNTDMNGRTLYHVAAINFRLNVISALFELGLNTIGEVDRWKKTPLHYAAEFGYLTVVEFLSTKIDVNAKDYLGKTALHYAAQNRYYDVLNVLTSAQNADINATDNRQKSVIFTACEGGSIRCVELLLQKGAAANIPANGGLTLPIVAVMSDNYDLMTLLASHMNPNDMCACDNKGWTPAHYAAQLGYTKFLEFIQENYPDIIYKANHKGRCPLAVASSWGRLDSLQFFSNVSDIDFGVFDNDGNTPLHLAIFGGHREFAKTLIRKREVEINAQNDVGETPLMLAISNWLKDVIQEIFSTGDWDPNLADHYGRTALMKASREGMADVVQVLLSHPKIDLTVSDIDGWGPQHFAALLRTPEVMKILEQKLKLDIITKKGMRPVDIARNNDNSEIVEFIARKQEEMMPRRRNAQQQQQNGYGAILRTASGSIHAAPDLRRMQPVKIEDEDDNSDKMRDEEEEEEDMEEDYNGEGAVYGDDDEEFRRAEREAMQYRDVEEEEEEEEEPY